MMKRPKGGKRSTKANLGRGYRLIPTGEVSERFTGWGHTRRAIRNLGVEHRQIAYRMTGRTLWSGDQDADLTELRSCLDWVADFPAQAAQQALDDVDQAYRNWWNPNHPAGPPTFERRSSRLSFRLPGQAVEVRYLNRKWSEVWVPKAGWVRFRRHRPLDGVVRSATFTFTPPTGWRVSFGIAAKTIHAPPNAKPGCGVDFGVACSAFVSTEDAPRIKPPSLTPGEGHRLLGLEQRKARQIAWANKHNGGRYSNRLRHTINQIAALRARQARRRLDFTHKLTADLAKNHGWVGVEDLRVKNMTASAKGTVENPGINVAQKARLNRGILDNAPGERRRQLSYKCLRYGSVLVQVPAPGTSQSCPECGVRESDNRPGCGRAFTCVQCGHQAHADKVGAINIERRAAHQLLAGGPPANSTGRPSQRPKPSRQKAGASVTRVAPAPKAGRAESRVA